MSYRKSLIKVRQENADLKKELGFLKRDYDRRNWEYPGKKQATATLSGGALLTVFVIGLIIGIVLGTLSSIG